MKLIAGLAVALAVVVLAIGVSSIARNAGAGDSSRLASINLEDYRFAPNRLDARVGVPVTLRLTNSGSERHDLNFPSLHMPGLVGVESILDPGQTRTVTLEFNEPGEHTFICSVPGHAAAGMTGAVYVSP